MRIDIGYYAFALFIAALICLIAILFKVLFSDVKRQNKLLDEKETKLLQLYQSVESVIEEWNDQVKATIEDIKEQESRAAKRLAAMGAPKEAPPHHEPPERLPRAERAESSRLRAAGEMLARAERIVKNDALKAPATHNAQNAQNAQNAHYASNAQNGGDNGSVFQRFFDDAASQQPPIAAEAPPSPQQSKNEAILALAEEGKTEAQIASELGVTRNEVKLVIGLTKRA